MIRVIERHLRPDRWDADLSGDPRCEGLQELYDVLRDVLLGPDEFPPYPSELAMMFRKQADLIDLWTDYDLPPDKQGTE